MLSILAGVMIGIGGVVYLSIGGVIGALLFSVGLLTIVTFKFHLFTGKAGLLPTNEITITDLIRIWIGNFIGTWIVAIGLYATPVGLKCFDAARPIIETRINNGSFANLILGIFCGLLMYIAVTGYAKTANVLFIIMPVATFILCGFNHCVADMFYTHIACIHIKEYYTLLPTTLGNIIGCCIIPLINEC